MVARGWILTGVERGVGTLAIVGSGATVGTGVAVTVGVGGIVGSGLGVTDGVAATGDGEVAGADWPQPTSMRVVASANMMELRGFILRL